MGDAGDGEQALPLIRKTKQDILITDIKMPFMDGLALSKIVASEMQEYEQFSRRRLFEEIVSGNLSIDECYLRARQLNMDIQGPCYNLILYTLQLKKENVGEGNEPLTRLRDEMFHYFMNHAEYLLVRKNLTTYAVLVKGEESSIVSYTNACVESIKEITNCYEQDAEWYVAFGTPVMRWKFLPECYAQVSRILAHRHCMRWAFLLHRRRLLRQLLLFLSLSFRQSL